MYVRALTFIRNAAPAAASAFHAAASIDARAAAAAEQAEARARHEAAAKRLTVAHLSRGLQLEDQQVH